MQEPAEAFTEMAERIGRINLREFAGAVLIVPPLDGDPIIFLTTDPKPDVIQFWANLKSRIEIRAADEIESQRNASPFNRGR